MVVIEYLAATKYATSYKYLHQKLRIRFMSKMGVERIENAQRQERLFA